MPRSWTVSELGKSFAQTLDTATGPPENMPAYRVGLQISSSTDTSSSPIKRQYDIHPGRVSILKPTPRKKYLDFMKFPPEVRNIIYGLLLLVEYPIPIVSPSGKGNMDWRRYRRFDNVTSLVSVSREIGDEARTFFYGGNTWVVGNGHWGSRVFVNRHGLKVFLSRIPRHAVALIKRLQIDIHFSSCSGKPQGSHMMHPVVARDLEGLTRSIVKYFRGVEKIVVVSTAELGSYSIMAEPNLTTGPVKAMTQLFELPYLKKICFLDHPWETSFQNVVDRMLEGKSGEKAKEKNIVVTVAKGVPERMCSYSHYNWNYE